MEKVSAILLAVGLSERMGTCKQLLPFGNKPAIVWCLECIAGAGIEDSVVVTGPYGKEVRKAIGRFSVTLMVNEAPG